MVRQSCSCCSRPAAYEFKNLENGRQGLLCEAHGNALDVRDPQRFLQQISSPTDETTKRLKQELSDAYGRHQLSGHRIRIEQPNLVKEKEVQQLAQQRETVKWRHEAGIDRWDHPRDLPPPPPPEPPGIGR
jgi:hypothetical protein